MYLCLDDKAVLLGRVGPYNLTFSPDSNRLFWADTTAQVPSGFSWTANRFWTRSSRLYVRKC
jgi:hypothetical protein